MINLNSLKNSEFTPWMYEDNDLLHQLRLFNNSGIDIPEQMQNLLKAFEILKTKFNMWMFENKSSLDEEEILTFLSMFNKHIDILKKNEGKNFEICRRSVNICFRLIQFLLSSIYDYPDPIFGVLYVPDEIESLI